MQQTLILLIAENDKFPQNNKPASWLQECQLS